MSQQRSQRNLSLEDEPSFDLEERFEELLAKLQLAKNQPRKLFDVSPEKARPRPSTVARAIFKSQTVVTSTPMVCNRKLTFNSDGKSVSPIEAPSSTIQHQKSQNNTSIEKEVRNRNSKNISHISLSSISDDNRQAANKSKHLEDIVSKLVTNNNANTTSKLIQTSQKSLSAVKKLARNATHIIKERQTQTGESLIGNIQKRLSPTVSSSSSDMSDFMSQCESRNLLGRNIFKKPSRSSPREMSINPAAPWRAPSGLYKNSPPAVNTPQVLSESSSLDETFLPKTVPKKKVFTNKRKLNKKRQSTNRTKIEPPALKNNNVSDKVVTQIRETRATSKRDLATSTNEKPQDANIIGDQQNHNSTYNTEKEAVNPNPVIENVQITSPKRVSNLQDREKIVTRSSPRKRRRVHNNVGDKLFPETRETRGTSKRDVGTSISEKQDPSIIVDQQNNKSTSIREEEALIPSPEIENVRITSPERVSNRQQREKVVTRSSSQEGRVQTEGNTTPSKDKPKVKKNVKAVNEEQKRFPVVSHEIEQVQSNELSFDLNQNKNKRTISQVVNEVNETKSRATPRKKRGREKMVDIRNDDPPFRENSIESVFDTPPHSVPHVIRTDEHRGEIELLAKESPTKAASSAVDSDKARKKVDKELRVVISSIDASSPNAASSSSKKDDANKIKSRSKNKSALTSSASSSQASLDNGSLRRSARERRPPPQRSMAGFVGTKSSYLYKFVTRDNSVKNVSKKFKNSTISSRLTGISPIREEDEFEKDNDDYVQPRASTNVSAGKSVSGRVSKKKTKKSSVVKKCNTSMEKNMKKNKCSVDICDSLKTRNTKLIFQGPIETLPLVDGIGMVITVNDSLGGYSAGYMKIAPGGHKPKQITNIHNMVFMVLEGRAQVGIEKNPTRIYAKHSVFTVIKGYEYFIKNMSAKEHLLLSFSRVVVQD